MGRRKKVAIQPDGCVELTIAITPELWNVLISVGKAHGSQIGYRLDSDERAGHVGCRLLMKRVSELIADNEVSWLGDRTFTKAIADLKDKNFGTIAAANALIDISKLHMNPKLKSGFHGVYANGQGFRAMSKDAQGRAIVIGTYPTSEEAAHRRMLYHRANNLAYGELEVEMEAWRADPVKWNLGPGVTDEELIRQIKAHCEVVGTLGYIFGPGCVSFEPVASKRLPKRAEALAKLPQKKPQKALSAGPDPVVTIDLNAAAAFDDGPQCEAKGQCEDLDGSGACTGCGRWLGSDEAPSEQRDAPEIANASMITPQEQRDAPEIAGHRSTDGPFGLDPNDLPESWR